MDRSTLTRRIHDSLFSLTRGSGYEQGEVDDFLDELVAALEAGDRDDAITALIAASAFTTTRLREGYSPQDVDALLDEVTAGLGGAPTVSDRGEPRLPTGPGEDAGAGSDPVGSQPSALIEPRTSFLARIFGR